MIKKDKEQVKGKKKETQTTATSLCKFAPGKFCRQYHFNDMF